MGEIELLDPGHEPITPRVTKLGRSSGFMPWVPKVCVTPRFRRSVR
jgi:hypothetical protein